MTVPPVPHHESDEPARVAVRTLLDTTMLVEAGAGSGKTTLMIDRLLAYIARGTPVDQLAAVTFTRKAANELRERLENRLEAEARHPLREPTEQQRLTAALRERERMFIGTVHAFCARVLREHALEAGLPPDFTELEEAETDALRASAYRAFLEHTARDNSALLQPLIAAGVDPFVLADSFAEFERYRDVEFPAPAVPRPAHEEVRDELVKLLEAGLALRAGLAEGERDALQKTMDRLWRRYRTHDRWNSATDFARDVTVLLSKSETDVVQKRWGDTPAAKKAAKDFGTLVQEWVSQRLSSWYTVWRAHVYPSVILLFSAASRAALASRRRSGQLGFDDLLTETARLLREQPEARRTVGERWRHLLVDEFQDTDPVQAEVCLLIASDAAEGSDWRTVRPRAGSLFVVGDPKQSIFRFRRADLAVYRMVQAQIERTGTAVQLTWNFRSVPAIATLVNRHFASVFAAPNDVTPAASHQAPFAPLVAASLREAPPSAGVYRYTVGPQGLASNDALVAEDAALVASWIAHRCLVLCDRLPQEFLILTATRSELAVYAHQLALRNIAVSVTGAESSADPVLQELLVIVRALADPGNAIAVIAALEGWCMGCSHVDLWEARQHGLQFSITHAPASTGSPVGDGLQQLHDWYAASQRLSAASVLERVMDESGLLVLAASGDLGDRNAGQLLQLVAMLRGGTHTDLAAAIEAIERTLTQEEDAPGLRAAPTNAVRLMNLHKAKGLEAPVVILAAPLPRKVHEPRLATWRDASGAAFGALLVRDARGDTVAHPINWAERAAIEAERGEAEDARLLYVAVTRAREELVVSQRATYTTKSKEVRGDASRWAALAPTLALQATHMTPATDIPPGRNQLTVPVERLAHEMETARQRRAVAQRPRYTLVSVTESAKQNAAEAEADGAPIARVAGLGDDGQPFQAGNPGMQPATPLRAREFGSLVHRAIEGALRGRDGPALQEYVEAIVWHALQAATRRECVAIAAEILHVVQEAKRTEGWLALMQSGALAELTVASVMHGDALGADAPLVAPLVLAEGVMDAAGRSPEGWVVVDWKFTRSGDAGWAGQLPAYQAQARTYVDALQKRTGISGTARIERLLGNPE